MANDRQPMTVFTFGVALCLSGLAFDILPIPTIQFFGRSDVLAASGGHTSTLAGGLDVQHGGSYKFSIVAVAVMCNSHRRRESFASGGVK